MAQKENLLDYAVSLHQQGHLDAAKQLYEKILENNPRHGDVLHLLGILSAQQKNHDLASDYIKRAINEKPNQPTYENSLGNVYKNLAQWDNAIIHYRKALALQPNYAVAHNNIANVFYQQDKLTEAETHYRRAILLNPKYADAYFNLGNVYLKKDKFPEAIKQYQATLQLQPNHSEAHMHLAQLLQLENKLDEAIMHYQKKLALEPDDVETQNNIATALIKQNKLSEAAPYLIRALETSPNHVAALTNLATVYLLENKLNEALKYFFRALQEGRDPEVYYNIGAIFMQQDRYEDAIQYLNEAVQLVPDYLNAHINLGAAYLKKEDRKNASKHYQIALALKPKDPELTYILAALQQKQPPEAAPKEYLQNLFDQYAQNFDDHLLNQLAYQAPNLLFNAVEKIIKDPNVKLKILDLGCGTGLAGEKFRTLASELIGIDLSSKMIAVAKEKKLYDELEVIDIETALKKYCELDLILAADVFTYIGNLEPIFVNCLNALNSQGLFAFTTEKTDQYPYSLKPTARYGHTKKYIEALSATTDFSIIEFQEVILRTQQNIPMEGYLFILQSTKLRS